MNMFSARRPAIVFFLILKITLLWPQNSADMHAEFMTVAEAANDPALLIGLSLTELIRQFGIPVSVFPVRGFEDWQDDVVFVYDEIDFYVFRDHVWQLGLKSIYRIRRGDPVAAVYLSLGEPAFRGEDFALYALKNYSWPVELRFNFDSSGIVTMIYIYRSDM